VRGFRRGFLLSPDRVRDGLPTSAWPTLTRRRPRRPERQRVWQRSRSQRKSTIDRPGTPISLSALSGEQPQCRAAESRLSKTSSMTSRVCPCALSARSDRVRRAGLASNGGAALRSAYLDEIPLSPPALSQSGKSHDPILRHRASSRSCGAPRATLYGSGSWAERSRSSPTSQTEHVRGLRSGDGVSNTRAAAGNYGGNLMLNLRSANMFALRLVGSEPVPQRLDRSRDLKPFPIDLATSSSAA